MECCLTPGGSISVWKQLAHPLVFLSYTHRHWYMCSLCASKCFSVCDDILGAGDAQWNSFSFFCLHRRSEEEVDMDKVTAAMVLTSLSTSPLVRSPPVKVNGQYHDYLTDAICLKLNSLKKKNSSVKPVICMFCFTFHSLTAVILWMHAEAQADKLPPPAVL